MLVVVVVVAFVAVVVVVSIVVESLFYSIKFYALPLVNVFSQRSEPDFKKYALHTVNLDLVFSLFSTSCALHSIFFYKNKVYKNPQPHF